VLEKMFVLSNEVFCSLLLMAIFLFAVVFPDLFCFFYFRVVSGLALQISNLIFSCASPSVRGSPLLLRL